MPSHLSSWVSIYEKKKNLTFWNKQFGPLSQSWCPMRVSGMAHLITVTILWTWPTWKRHPSSLCFQVKQPSELPESLANSNLFRVPFKEFKGSSLSNDKMHKSLCRLESVLLEYAVLHVAWFPLFNLLERHTLGGTSLGSDYILLKQSLQFLLSST